MITTTVKVLNTAKDNRFFHDAARPWIVWCHIGAGGGWVRGRYTTETVAKRYARKADRELNHAK